MKLAPLAAAVWTFKRHLAQILNYVPYRVKNAVSEGLNSEIQTIKQKSVRLPTRHYFYTIIISL
jgi:transposase